MTKIHVCAKILRRYFNNNPNANLTVSGSCEVYHVRNEREN